MLSAPCFRRLGKVSDPMSAKISPQEKIDSYQKFWKREPVRRPLVGFDAGGYFPLRHFKSLQLLQPGEELVPRHIRPGDFVDDYERLYEQSQRIDDDFIWGVSPLTAFPWMEAMLGCPAQLAEESIWAVERHADWEELESISIDDDNPWLRKYLEFLQVLTHHAAGRYPVGQPIFRGVTDIIGALRGHDQALIDGMESPERIRSLGAKCASALVSVLKRQFEIVQPFMGGYVVEQYGLWAPDRIARLQEDASSIYSPDMYVDLIQESDRFIASSFPLSIIHLHSSSLFIIDAFLEIGEIDVFQVNRDVGGMELDEMMPALQKIQASNRSLVLRGSLTPDDLRLAEARLEPTGLLIQIVVDQPAETKELRELIDTLWKQGDGNG